MKDRSDYLGVQKKGFLSIEQLHVYDPPIEVLWNKSRKAEFVMNRVDLSDLSDKPFSNVASRSALLFPAVRHVCLFFHVVGVISTPV